MPLTPNIWHAVAAASVVSSLLGWTVGYYACGPQRKAHADEERDRAKKTKGETSRLRREIKSAWVLIGELKARVDTLQRWNSALAKLVNRDRNYGLLGASSRCSTGYNYYGNEALLGDDLELLENGVVVVGEHALVRCSSYEL